MRADPLECMFCQERLVESHEVPVNLAFMSHLEEQEPCQRAFDSWRTNLAQDYLGY